ncbi:MAG: hypothetical protein ABFD54_03060 [Armatimonadota bacterium]|nr:hypothetical protein [bacterium]
MRSTSSVPNVVLAEDSRRETVTDRKSAAIILGTVVGIAAVAATVGVYVSRHHEQNVENVNDIFEKARETVRKLDEAVDLLRKPAA